MTEPKTYIDPFLDDSDVWEGAAEDDQAVPAPSCNLENPEICESCT